MKDLSHLPRAMKLGGRSCDLIGMGSISTWQGEYSAEHHCIFYAYHIDFNMENFVFIPAFGM